MTGLIGLATGGAWKYVAAAVGAAGLISTAAVGFNDWLAHRDLKRETAQVAKLTNSLALETANYATLKAGADAQRASIDAASQIGATKLVEAEKLVASSQAANAKLLARNLALLSTPLAGTTPCARMDDADARIMGDLK